MAIDRGLDVSREIRIDSGSRIFRKQCDTFGDSAPNRFGRAKNCDGRLAVFDDDLDAGTHARQELFNIAGRFRFGNVNHVLRHDGHCTAVCMSWAGPWCNEDA